MATMRGVARPASISEPSVSAVINLRGHSETVKYVG